MEEEKKNQTQVAKTEEKKLPETILSKPEPNHTWLYCLLSGAVSGFLGYKIGKEKGRQEMSRELEAEKSEKKKEKSKPRISRYEL